MSTSTDEITGAVIDSEAVYDAVRRGADALDSFFAENGMAHIPADEIQPDVPAFSVAPSDPGAWRDLINTDRLSISDSSLCVLGQLFGWYHHAPSVLRRIEGAFGHYGPEFDGMNDRAPGRWGYSSLNRAFEAAWLAYLA